MKIATLRRGDDASERAARTDRADRLSQALGVANADVDDLRVQVAVLGALTCALAAPPMMVDAHHERLVLGWLLDPRAPRTDHDAVREGGLITDGDRRIIAAIADEIAATYPRATRADRRAGVRAISAAGGAPESVRDALWQIPYPSHRPTHSFTLLGALSMTRAWLRGEYEAAERRLSDSVDMIAERSALQNENGSRDVADAA